MSISFSCHICLDEFPEGLNKASMQTQCQRHWVCETCASNWRDACKKARTDLVCPVCREVLEERNMVQMHKTDILKILGGLDAYAN